MSDWEATLYLIIFSIIFAWIAREIIYKELHKYDTRERNNKIAEAYSTGLSACKRYESMTWDAQRKCYNEDIRKLINNEGVDHYEYDAC